MTTRLFTVERMEVASKKSFEETAAAFEKRVPQADIDVFTRLIAVRGSRALCEAALRHLIPTGD